MMNSCLRRFNCFIFLLISFVSINSSVEARDYGFWLSRGEGLAILGSQQEHDFVKFDFFASDVLFAPDALNSSKESFSIHDWEWSVAATGGWETAPKNDRYFIALSPFIRHYWRSGRQWRPFVELSIGLSQSDIGRPDLSSNFNFIDQIGFGTKIHQADSDWSHWIIFRWVHLSNAGLYPPNLGTNTLSVVWGMSWGDR